MQNSTAEHRRIIEHAKIWRGAPLAMATVIQTWRSAPCPVGTHMLVHGDGRFVGSVSGGCVEADILQNAADIIAGAPFIIREYGVADGSAWQVGLPCGGDIRVMIQMVSDAGFPAPVFEQISAARAAGRAITVSTNLKTGRSQILHDNDGTTQTDGNDFINLYLPKKRLIIVGAVEIATALSDIAKNMGLEITIIDPRGHFLTAERFPGILLDDRWPDEAIADLKPDARTAIITLSHDPKIDDPALIAALNSDAGYIASLGSNASHAKRTERLMAAGIGKNDIARIEGPAGVAINAISTSEIALSIAGGMVRAFNKGLR